MASIDAVLSAIEQVNTAVSQMDEVTQQNAALVEQASSAAASLEEQAAQLESAVAIFRLSANEQPRVLEAPNAQAKGKPRQKVAAQLASGPSAKPVATAHKESELEWAEL